MQTANQCFKASLCFAYGCLLLLAMPLAANASASGGGITTVGPIFLSGAAVLDSWNSQGGTIPYSASVAQSNAVALTDSTNNPAITLAGGSVIHGTAVTGPGGTVAGAANVSGGTANNANFFINPVGVPAWSTNGSPYSITTTNGIVNGTNYTIAMSTGNYKLPSLVVTGGQKMVVNGIVNIYLTSTGNNVLTVSGSSFIYIMPGSSLNLWSAGNMTISGGGIANGSAYAASCNIYGLRTCTSITYSGSANLYGLVDAPTAAFVFSGLEQMYGSLVVGSVDISSGKVHFDESLLDVTTIWITSQPANQAVPLGSDVTFSVSIGGGLPTSYQWYFNQTNLLSSVTNYLSLTNVQLSDAGSYSVIVTNFSSGVASAPAILFVYTNSAQIAPQLGPPSSSMNGQFQFDVTGLAGFNYAIRTSTNLVDWIPLATKVSPFTFTDTNNLPLQFYRSVFVP